MALFEARIGRRSLSMQLAASAAIKIELKIGFH
jgi:hypothetical protein